jgi:alkylation response protein AidB-like acyl-CoA dehydrogenase
VGYRQLRAQEWVDLAKTQAIARPGPTDGVYRLTGQKSFGGGSGMTSYMMTTAMPAGETAPDVFVLDMRQVAWDGTARVALTAPWEGHGMAATQSYAHRLAGTAVAPHRGR